MLSAGNSSGGSHISIPVGITIGLLASFVQSLGLTIQRKSHVQNQALPESEQRVEHRRPLWLLGFGIFISSNLFGSIFQIASLPVVILAPLGAVSLLWNAFFSRLLLGDVFSPWMILGTLLIAGGAVLIAVFGIVPEPTHSLEDLLLLFSRPAFIAYFSLLGITVTVCLAITHILEYSYSRRTASQTTSPPLSPLLAPDTDLTIVTTAATPSTVDEASPIEVTERTPLLDRKTTRASSPSPTASTFSSSLSNYVSPSRTPVLLAMSYASFSGIISGMCLLLAKSGVELLLLTIGGKNQFWRWQAWMLVLGLVVCALLQLWYMHKSLILANPTLVCPLAFCFYNISSILNGLIYFDQFSLLSTTHLLLVALGITILLAGVYIVSFPPGGAVGVDIGTWDNDSGVMVNSEDLEHENLEGEVYEDEPLPMVAQLQRASELAVARSRSPGDGEQEEEIIMNVVPNIRGRSESTLRIVTRAPSEREPQIGRTSPTSQQDSSPHLRRQTDSAVLPRTSYTSYPSTISRSTSGAAPTISATSPVSRRRRPLLPVQSAALTSPRQSLAFPPFSNSLASGAPSTLGGFSIGLSPASPGFALVPSERVLASRRRRVTGNGLPRGFTYTDGEEIGGESGAEGLQGKKPRRRTMSDGELNHAEREGAREEARLLGDSEAGWPAGGQRGEDELPGPQTRRAKGRWKWLKDVIHLRR